VGKWRIMKIWKFGNGKGRVDGEVFGVGFSFFNV
jgi:hypothetical protein